MTEIIATIRSELEIRLEDEVAAYRYMHGTGLMRQRGSVWRTSTGYKPGWDMDYPAVSTRKEQTKSGKKGPGRPRSTMLSDELIKKIAKEIADGRTIKYATAFAGVSESMFYEWMKRGRETKRKPWADLAEAVTKAEEQAKAYHLELIKQIAQGGHKTVKTSTKKDSKGSLITVTETIESSLPSLQASIWILERRFPDEFGPKQRIDLGTDANNPFQVSLFNSDIIPGSAKGQEIHEVSTKEDLLDQEGRFIHQEGGLYNPYGH